MLCGTACNPAGGVAYAAKAEHKLTKASRPQIEGVALFATLNWALVAAASRAVYSPAGARALLAASPALAGALARVIMPALGAYAAAFAVVPAARAYAQLLRNMEIGKQNAFRERAARVRFRIDADLLRPVQFRKRASWALAFRDCANFSCVPNALHQSGRTTCVRRSLRRRVSSKPVCKPPQRLQLHPRACATAL